jgi:hypothetical protein
MRISHRNLEWLRNEPSRVARIRQGGGWNSTMALYRAVRVYHDLGEPAAFDRLEADLAALNDRVGTHLLFLGQYADSYVAQGNIAFQYPFRVEIDLGSGITLGGEIARIDLVPAGGYSAWIFRTKPKPRRWFGHLNMPLLQGAVALELGVPNQDVSIGYYWFAPNEYSARTYTDRQVAQAVTEARLLAAQIAGQL